MKASPLPPPVRLSCRPGIPHPGDGSVHWRATSCFEACLAEAWTQYLSGFEAKKVAPTSGMSVSVSASSRASVSTRARLAFSSNMQLMSSSSKTHSYPRLGGARSPLSTEQTPFDQEPMLNVQGALCAAKQAGGCPGKHGFWQC